MRIRWQTFLVASVLSGMAALPACSVEVISGPTAGVGGTGGSAGAGGTGGAKGDAAPSADGQGSDATGDTVNTDGAVDGPAIDVSTTPDVSPDVTDASTSDGGTSDGGTFDGGTFDGGTFDGGATDGAIADAPADAAGACFAEDAADAGPTTSCTMLPYFGTLCRDDAGFLPPAGFTLCETLEPDLKKSALQHLFACLQALPGADGGMDACSVAHDQGAADCSRGIFNRSMCPVPDGVAEGGLYGCAQIASSCGPDSGDGGIPLELCQAWLGPFHAAARQAMIDCYLDPDDVGATSCRDKFENHCVFP